MDVKNSLQKQLNSGATSLVLLALLHQQKRAMYGYEVAKALEIRCEGPLPMKAGALYPVLRSLEKQGLLVSHLEPSDAGPSRKYYQITAAGRATLKQWQIAWQDTKLFVDNILENHDGSVSKNRGRALPRRAKSTAKPHASKVAK